MGKRIWVIAIVLAVGSLAICLLPFPAPTLASATSAPDQISEPIDDNDTIGVPGDVRPEATTANDRGRVADDFPLDHLILQLRRSPQQKRKLLKLLDELEDSNSPNYHHWLTADEFGNRFGASPRDINNISAWLRAHGFRVNYVYPSGMLIDFSGNAGSIRDAFHTELHWLSVNGKKHFANMSDPRIPAALAPTLAGVVSLNDFRPHPMYQRRTDYTTSSGYQLLVPADLATIYDFNPLFAAGYSGKGQTIVTVEDTNLYTTANWTTFRSVFGLSSAFPSGTLTQVHPAPGTGGACTNPGVNADDAEAAIDVEWASAAAPNAAIELASCADTSTNFGGFIALQNLLSESGNPPAIVSISYGEAEASLGATTNAYISGLYQQAVAEGVSVFVSSGDEGAASADPNAAVATHGIAVSGFTSTPYNVSVGGTDFSDTYSGTVNSYWGSSNGTTYGSALSYIPEIPWNDSCAGELFAAFEGYPSPYGSTGFCNSIIAEFFYLDTSAGSGGPSGCATGSPSSSDVVSGTCAGYNKPAWQSILGNPADGVRDVPDVSLFAANGLWGHYYVACYSDPSNGGAACTGTPDTWAGFGGTSISSPIMAGIQALINQRTASRQGNPNPTYYSLAAAEYGASGDSACNSSLGNAVNPSCVFYDVTLGDMDVDCTGTDNCYTPSGTYGVLSTSNSAAQPAFAAGVGWDFATGIGTVNANNLVIAFGSPVATTTPTATASHSATPSATPTPSAIATATKTATPTVSATATTSATATPTVTPTATPVPPMAFVGSTNNTGSTVTLPALSPGDLIILVTVAAGGGVSTPPGYTLLDSDSTTGDFTLKDFYKVAGSGESGFTLSNSPDTSWGTCVYSGENPATPIDAHNHTGSTNSSTMTLATATANFSNDWIVGVGGIIDTFTVNNSFNQRFLQPFVGGTAYGSLCADSVLSSSGSTGTVTLGALSATDGWSSGTILIRPAAAITATPTAAASLTATPTATATATASNTGTATASATSTTTATATATATATPTATSTPTATATLTPTTTATSTSTATATATATATTTATATRTATSTATATATVTATTTATSTSTATSTASPTSTSTVSATPTATATPVTTVSVTASLAFGNVAVGQTLAKNLTINNTGATNPLFISNATSSDLAEFALSGTGTCGAVPITIAPKTSCTMGVAFTPNAVGAHSAKLMIFDNAITSPQSSTLSGTGIAGLTVSKTSLVFGSEKFGVKSVQSFSVTNHQTQQVALAESFSGPNAADFSVSGGTCTATLAANSVCSIIVTFTPGALGIESATLSISDTPDPLGPYSVAISTGATIPETVAPLTLAYGTVAQTSSKTLKTTVTNKSPFTISIGSAVSGANATDFTITGGTCAASLAGNSSCTIGVKFKPTTAAAESATLAVTVPQDPTSPQNVSLTGTGM